MTIEEYVKHVQTGVDQWKAEHPVEEVDKYGLHTLIKSNRDGQDKTSTMMGVRDLDMTKEELIYALRFVIHQQGI